MEFSNINPWAILGLRVLVTTVAVFAFYSIGYIWIKKQTMTISSNTYAVLAGAVMLGSIWSSVTYESDDTKLILAKVERLERHADQQRTQLATALKSVDPQYTKKEVRRVLVKLNKLEQMTRNQQSQMLAATKAIGKLGTSAVLAYQPYFGGYDAKTKTWAPQKWSPPSVAVLPKDFPSVTPNAPKVQ